LAGSVSSTLAAPTYCVLVLALLPIDLALTIVTFSVTLLATLSDCADASGALVSHLGVNLTFSCVLIKFEGVTRHLTVLPIPYSSIFHIFFYAEAF